MKLIDALVALQKINVPLLTTRDAAAYWKISCMHASQLLSRLAKSGNIIALNRAHWVMNKNSDPLIIPEFLTAPWPSYISLQTALFYHGMIEQIPQTIYVISLGRTKLYETPLGAFSVHQIHPDLFLGFELFGKDNIKMASPEKALIDIFYLKTARSKLFHTLPELEIPKTFNHQKMQAIIERIPDQKRRGLVENLAKLSLNK